MSLLVLTRGEIRRLSIKALLCVEVNTMLWCADSSRKSSQQISGVTWDVRVRNRAQL